MKSSLDYIYETGCRNIDAAIERVISRYEQRACNLKVATEAEQMAARISLDGFYVEFYGKASDEHLRRAQREQNILYSRLLNQCRIKNHEDG